MDIPRDLAAISPKYFVELGDRRIVAFMAIIAYVGVYAFATGPNGWVRVLPPVLGPILAALFLTARPWDPYKSIDVSKSDPIIVDPRTERLRSLLRSIDALRIVWRAAAVSTIVLGSLAFLTATLAENPRSWDFKPSEVLIPSVCLGVFALGWMNHCLLVWLVRIWRDETLT
jgi:hypothetical protein